jgi:hypothetical protein
MDVVYGASITPNSASCVRSAEVPRDCRAEGHFYRQRDRKLASYHAILRLDIKGNHMHTLPNKLIAGGAVLISEDSWPC